MARLTMREIQELDREKALTKLVDDEKVPFWIAAHVQKEMEARKLADREEWARMTPGERRAWLAAKVAELPAKASHAAPRTWDGQLPMEKLHARAERLLVQSLSAGEAVLGQLRGAGSQYLVLTDQRALVIKVGFMAGQTLGGKVVAFPYRSITSVEVRISIATGSFEIATGGVQGTERSYWSNDKNEDAWKAPNVVPITRVDVKKFQAAAAFIRERAQAISVPTVIQAPPFESLADELAKLAALRDQGVLTGEEFSAQKARLLGAGPG